MYNEHNEHNELIFDSFDAYIDYAQQADISTYERNYYGASDSFCGGSFDEAFNLASNGWRDHQQDVMTIAEDAVKLVRKDMPFPTFRHVNHVVGSVVNVGLYNQGVPECMIMPVPMQVSKSGRVVTLCVGIGANQGVSNDQFIKQGTVAAALAMALIETGHAVEIWADKTSQGNRYGGFTNRVRVKIKAAHDVIDPSRLIYALAHPTMTRRLSWRVLSTIGGGGHNVSVDPIQDMEEGTVYLPAMRYVDGDKAIRNKLVELGLIGESV